MKLYDFKRLMIYLNRLGLINGFLVFCKVLFSRNVEVKVKGYAQKIFMRQHTSDMYTFDQVIILEEYNLKLPLNPKVIIDAGANVGFATIYFKNKYPNSKIFSIEPDPDNFSILEKNTKNYSDIRLIQKGLWNKSTFTRIVDKHNLGKWAMVIEEVETKTADSIETITIDRIMSDNHLTHIDLLKIDIETAEQYLFSSNYENWLSKTKVIVIELHDWMEKGTAQPFLMAITKTFNKFSFYQSGENVIVVNEDLN